MLGPWLDLEQPDVKPDASFVGAFSVVLRWFVVLMVSYMLSHSLDCGEACGCAIRIVYISRCMYGVCPRALCSSMILILVPRQ